MIYERRHANCFILVRPGSNCQCYNSEAFNHQLGRYADEPQTFRPFNISRAGSGWRRSGNVNAERRCRPININTWYECGFGGPGGALGDCLGCVPSVPVSTDAGTAPWTISLAGPATLTVLDLFLSIDQFEMFNNLVSIGTTSAPVSGGACGGDIACSLADARYSRGIFNLGAGDYSFTGTQLLGQAGAGVFRIESARDVPEPASYTLLVAAALAGASVFRRRKSQA